MLASLVFIVWSEFATERMSSRRWNDQHETKLKLEHELKALQDQTWHMKINTKKGKDLTDTCRQMAGWTGDLLMEISKLHTWGYWKLWHVEEMHKKVMAKARRQTEARVMQERMRTTWSAQTSEARTQTELLPPKDKEKAARAERLAAALQRVYRRRLTGALVAMLTKSPRRPAWYEKMAEPQLALESHSNGQALALPPFSGPSGGVASTLDFLARAQQRLVEGQNRQSHPSPTSPGHLPDFGSPDARGPRAQSPGDRMKFVPVPRADGPNLVITGVRNASSGSPALSVPPQQRIEEQMNLQDTLSHMQSTMQRMNGGEPGSA